MFEALEKKEMLSADAPRVLDIVADNRGFVQVTLDADLNAATVNQASVRFFTAGDDGLLGTEDDGAVNNVDISYTFGDRTITADARLIPGESYGVILDGSLIRGTNGCFLDGEFNGLGMTSGDGTEGGDTLFYARSTGPTIARISTNFGVIDITLFPDETPITVANFLRYANERLYDRTIFHRSAALGDGTPFVIQGGGFEANLPFLPIPTFDPILNEPGISNVRGTIALAKLGNNPNSGTSQFFFNLSDNSGNLDNQNGGFTVFGEILNEESLAVIDAIAMLETFNATATQGAFNEVPVQDLDLIEDTSGVLMERDVVRIDRVAQLLTVSAEPFGQLDTDEVRTITQDGNGARVTLFSLSGAPLGSLDDFIRVNFGGGDSITSITFTSEPPAMVGVQISGASRVGSITERSNASGSLAFIVSNARVDSLRISTSIAGTQLNGVLLADGLLLPEDIDGDNVFNDSTTVFIQEGTTRSARFDGGLSGDVLLPGGLVDLQVKGVAAASDIRIGANESDAPLRVRFDTARDVVLISDSVIREARADEWGPFLTQNARLEAPSIERLNIKNDFLADVFVTDPNGDGLGRAQIRGDLLRSSWNILGGIDRLKFDGAATWTLNVTGDVLVVRGGETRGVTLDISGEVRDFKVDDIDGGVITLGSALRFVAAKGDVLADITIGAGLFEMRQFRVGGDLIDSNVSLGSDVRSFKIRGDITDSNVNGQSFRDLRFKRVTNTDFVANGDARKVTITSWDGGEYRASETRAFRTVGDRRADDPGDFNADFVVSNAVRVTIAGGIADSDFRMGDNRVFTVGGDIVDSEVRFFRLFVFATIAAVDVNINGSLIGSQVYVASSLNSIRTDAMIDSAIYVGSTGTLTGFASAFSIDPNARVQSILVRGINNGQADFEDSFIVGGRIDYVRVTNPEFFNGSPFGVAGGTIERFEVVSDALTQGITDPSEGVVVLEDLEVRPGFQAPV